MLYTIFPKTGGDSAPTLSKSLGASCEFWGNPPSIALDATLVQYLTGKTHIERLYWKYIYLKATDN